MLPCSALPGPPTSPPTKLARLAQVHGPVQAQHLAVQRLHVLQPQAAALGEDDARHDLAVHAGAFELRQHARRVGQAEGLERAVGQHAAPAVENHHGLGAGVDLRVQVLPPRRRH
jgi:hypothetical protein